MIGKIRDSNMTKEEKAASLIARKRITEEFLSVYKAGRIRCDNWMKDMIDKLSDPDNSEEGLKLKQDVGK